MSACLPRQKLFKFLNQHPTEKKPKTLPQKALTKLCGSVCTYEKGTK